MILRFTPKETKYLQFHDKPGSQKFFYMNSFNNDDARIIMNAPPSLDEI